MRLPRVALVARLSVVALMTGCHEEETPPLPSSDVCVQEDLENGRYEKNADLTRDRFHCGECGHECGKYNICGDRMCLASRNVALWPIPELPLTDDHYEVDDGTVRDRVTGLEWQRHVGDRVPWEMAIEHCDSLNLDGGGWRLPTRIELQSIVDFTRRLPAINDEVFPMPDDEAPWGAYPDKLYCPGGNEPFPNLVFAHRRFKPNPICEYVVYDDDRNCGGMSLDFMEGTQRYYDYQAGEVHNCTPVDQFVRCVRGGPDVDPVERRFEIEDETALDVYTRLRWQRFIPECGHPFEYCEQAFETLAEAEAYCEDLVADGHDDFRVPSVTELLTLIYPWMEEEDIVEAPDGKHATPWLDDEAFPEELNDADLTFYSSTPYLPRADFEGATPWVVRYETHDATWEVGARRVRCVQTER